MSCRAQRNTSPLEGRPTRRTHPTSSALKWLSTILTTSLALFPCSPSSHLAVIAGQRCSYAGSSTTPTITLTSGDRVKVSLLRSVDPNSTSSSHTKLSTNLWVGRRLKGGVL